MKKKLRLKTYVFKKELRQTVSTTKSVLKTQLTNTITQTKFLSPY